MDQKSQNILSEVVAQNLMSAIGMDLYPMAYVDPVRAKEMSEELMRQTPNVTEEQAIGAVYYMAAAKQAKDPIVHSYPVLTDRVVKDAINHTHKLDAEEYRKDPYLQNIHVPQKAVRKGSYTLSETFEKPYEIFAVDMAFEDSTGVYAPIKTGYFSERFQYPILQENGKTWMTVSPSEMETMKKGIQDAHGNILVFGLGLGYYAFMVTRKPEVSGVTVVELSQDVIDLFTEQILPQFGPVKDKISIVQADATRYVREVPDGQYDYCYADIWRGIDYDSLQAWLKVAKTTEKWEKTKVGYWLEPQMYHHIADVIVGSLMDKMAGVPKSKVGENMGKILGKDMGRFMMNYYVDKAENLSEELVKEMSSEQFARKVVKEFIQKQR